MIAKFDLTGEEEVKYSAKLKMAHSNDMTYNSNTKQIIVCHARGNERGLTILNAATLEKVGGKEDIGFAFHGIDYNAANDCYVVYTGSTHYCYILNANFEPIMKYESKNVRPDVEGTLSPQGMGCDDKYIYYLYAWSGDAATHEQIISVIDWNGNHITNIRFSFDEEAETIIFMNNKIYVNVLKESKLYELNIQ